jgi:hypothetical protein
VALTHLVGTSVIHRLGQAEVREVVDPLVHGGRLRRAGITDLEVGCGSRNAPEWDHTLRRRTARYRPCPPPVRA